MNEEIRRTILEKIKEYKKIIITRHIRPDGDAIGSTRGLEALITAAYPDKWVRVANNDYSDLVSFIDPSEETLSKQDYTGALLIVLDTSEEKRISNSHVRDAAEIVRIDHHIDATPFCDIAWVEDKRSSTCELIAELSFESDGALPMNEKAALCLYTGMVTDTGRFRYNPSKKTFEIAGRLLEYGIETDKLYSRLYIDSFEALQFKADMLSRINRTENGVAWLYVTQDMQRKYNLNREEASFSVAYMEGIRGSLIWLAFIDNMPEDSNYSGPSVRVRLRSRFVPVNELAAEYHGGGHANASGATVYTEKEMKELISKADALLGEFKKKNPELQ